MESFSLSALVSRLVTLDSTAAWQLAGWTMLHFLWVGTIVAAVAGLLRFAVRRARSQVRYLTALALLGLFAAAPGVIAGWILHVQGDDYAPQGPRGGESFFAADARSALVAPRGRESFSPATIPGEVARELAKKTPDPVPAAPTFAALRSASHSEPREDRRTSHSALDMAAGVLPYVWVGGAPCMFLLLATGLVGGERLRRQSRLVADGPLVSALEELRQSLGGRAVRRLAVAVCDRVTSPVLVGIVRPLVLFPPAAATGWSPEQIEMILLHELAHVRRWDNFVNLAQRLIESLLFFHPAVWWLSGWVRQEREHCCDAFVVRHLEQHGRRSSRRSYARLLLELAAADRPRPIAAAGNAFAARNLRTRVRHILNMEEQPMRVSLKTLLATLALATLTVALTTTAARGLGDSDDVPGGPAEISEAAEDADAAVEPTSLIEKSIDQDDRPDPLVIRPEETEDALDERSAGDAEAPPEARSPSDLFPQEYTDAVAELNAKWHEVLVRPQELGGSSHPDQIAAVKMALSRWQAIRAERRKLQDELANAYMAYQMSLVQQKAPGVIERMVQETISTSPRLQQLQMQLLWLNTQIDQLRITVGNRRSSAVARLEEQKQQIAQQMQQIESQERQRLTSDYESQPNLMLKLLRKQYDVQRQVYGARIAKLDQEAEEIVAELERLARQDNELRAILEDLKALSSKVDELSRNVEELVPERANREGPPAEDSSSDDTASNAANLLEVPQQAESDEPGDAPDKVNGGRTDEAVSNGDAVQSDSPLREEYKRKADELNTRREEYFELAERLGGSSDPNQNFEVKMALMRWQANRAERRLLQNELANAYMQYQLIATREPDEEAIEAFLDERVAESPTIQALESSRSVAETEGDRTELTDRLEKARSAERQRLAKLYDESRVAELARKHYEVQADVYRQRIVALDQEAEKVTEEMRRLTKQNAELIQRQQELERLAEQVASLEQRLQTSQEQSLAPDRADAEDQPQEDAAGETTAEVKLLADEELVSLAVGKKLILVLDGRVPRIQVNDPDLVAVTALSADRIQLEGKQPGETRMNVWDESGAVRTVTVLVYQTIAREPDDDRRGETVSEEMVNDRAWKSLGMKLQESDLVNLRNFRGGLQVAEVQDAGPADAAKIREGDVLVGLHRWETTSFADLDYVLGRVLDQNEREVKFYVVRDGDLLHGQLSPVRVVDNVEPPQSEPFTARPDEPQRRDAGAKSDAAAAARGRNLTYDGHGFDHWKTVWRTELKTERRTEAIRALAAFGAHDYGREAAETILDVIRNYDLENVRSDQPEWNLKWAAVDAFAGDGVRIPLADGLAILHEKTASGEPRVTSFTRSVLGKLPPNNPEVPPHVLKFAASDSTDLRVTANHRLRDIYDNADDDLRGKIVDILRKSIAADEKYVALTGLWGLYPIIREDLSRRTEEDIRVGYVPELLNALKHADSDVTSAAIEVFGHLRGEARDAVPELREMLQTLPANDGFPALLALGKIGPTAAEAAADVLELLEETESESIRERIIIALAEMRAAPQVVFEYYLGGDTRVAVARMADVIPHLAEQYGQSAKPAAPQVAPFLLSSDASVRNTALVVLETITGSHDFAEQYLKRFVTRLPASEQAERSLEILQRIEELRKQQRSESRATSGEVGMHEEVLRARELDRRLSAGAADLPKSIEKLQSSEPDEIKEALVNLQLLGPLGKEAAKEVAAIAEKGPEDLRQLAMGTLLRMKAAPEYVLGEYLEAADPIVVRLVKPDDYREIVTAEYSPREIVAVYEQEAVPHLLPLLASQEEEVHRLALQGLADQKALDTARRYLERRLAETPAEEDAEHIARMLKWVNALIEYYAEQRGGGNGSPDEAEPKQ